MPGEARHRGDLVATMADVAATRPWFFAPLEKRRDGSRSTRRYHARLYRVQAAELPDDEVEAERSRPDRVQEVLPLVRSAYPAQGDPLMASRSQRRAQRRAQGAGSGGAAASGDQSSFSQRARQRQQQVRPAQQSARGQTGRREAQRGSFVRESYAELRKVEWPDQRQVTTGTIVVIIACAITGLYLWLNDLLWQRVIEAIL